MFRFNIFFWNQICISRFLFYQFILLFDFVFISKLYTSSFIHLHSSTFIHIHRFSSFKFVLMLIIFAHGIDTFQAYKVELEGNYYWEKNNTTTEVRAEAIKDWKVV